VQLWNHYSTIISEEARTNNAVEGFNSSWTKALPGNAGLWTVLHTFQEVRDRILPYPACA